MAGFYRILLGFTGFHRVIMGLTGFYWVLLGFTGFYWVLLGYIGFLSVGNGLEWRDRVPGDRAGRDAIAADAESSR